MATRSQRLAPQPIQAPSPSLQIEQIYSQWKALHPEGTVEDFSWFVEKNSGFQLSSLLTDEQVQALMDQISPDEMLAEAILEGLEAGP